MYCICLDMEGVVTPEIWIEFAKESGIPELKITTRDEPDYDKLMKYRMRILRERGVEINRVLETIGRIEPLPGAKEFLDELRSFAQVVIVSDTFEEFCRPLIKKLGMPTIFCNSIDVDAEGYLCKVNMRCDHSKLTTVRALQSMGYETIAFGDSYNDLEMIRASKAGFLFRTTEQIAADNPDIPAFDSYAELAKAIKAAMTRA